MAGHKNPAIVFMKVQFLTSHMHRAGNGVTVFYKPGDVDTFDEAYANALVYECIATIPSKEVPAEARSTKVIEPEETKPKLTLKK